MKIRDRIVGLERVKASALVCNRKNWRQHPPEQKAALLEMLNLVGCADGLIARRLPCGGLELIDGHLRASVLGDQEVPVLVLDVDEQEAAKLLLTIDPLSAMADSDPAALAALIEKADEASTALASMYEQMAEKAGLNALADAASKQAEELDVDGYEMSCQCPECGFEFEP
jgi:hypothetical protein